MKTNKKIIICNAFSLQMLKIDKPTDIQTIPVPVNIVRELLKDNEYTSAVGHEDTARVLNVECNRINVTIDEDTWLVVAQLMNGRLPEGNIIVPVEHEFNFYIVHINKDEFSEALIKRIEDSKVPLWKKQNKKY